MTASLPSLRSAAAAVAISLLAACSSAPQPRLLLLANDVAVPSAAANAQRPLLVVRTVMLPEYLDRHAVIYRSADAELQRFHDTQWAERLNISVTRWITQQLAADLPQYEVQAFTAAGEQMPVMTLNVELQSFEPNAAAGAAPVLHLRGNWHLSGKAATDGRLSVDTPMSALDPQATVAAMKVALGEASEGIAGRVRGVAP